MEKKGVLIIHGDEAFKKAVRRDLKRMARTQCGRKLMKDIERTGHHVDIQERAAYEEHRDEALWPSVSP